MPICLQNTTIEPEMWRRSLFFSVVLVLSYFGATIPVGFLPTSLQNSAVLPE